MQFSSFIKEILIDKLNEPRLLKIIIPLSAVAVISRTFPLFSYFYYLLPLLFLLIILAGYKFVFKNRALKNLVILLLIFSSWAALTSLWSDYPLVSLSRTGYFIFIFPGAILGGYLWRHVSSDILSFLLPANIIIVSLSLFSLLTNIPGDSWSGGNGNGFMGFAGHQNTLASAILFTIPSVIFPSLEGNNLSRLGSQAKAERGGFLLLLFLNLLILLLTYSRASILALICGAIIFLILNKKWNVLIYSSAVTLLILSLIWFSPSLKEKINKLTKKDFPAFYSTREWMWVPSYNAALNGGLTGLGYGISDPDVFAPGTGSYFKDGRYIREKGNSFLALIEEVGVVGFVLFIFPLGYVLIKSRHLESGKLNLSSPDPHPFSPAFGGIPLWRDISHLPSSMVISSLIAFIIHSQFEAWMVGVGSIQLPLFFFYLGLFISLPSPMGDKPGAAGTMEY